MEQVNTTASYFSAINGKDISIVQMILDFGTDRDATFENGENALTVAIENNDFKMVVFLLKYGVPVDLKNKFNETPLLVALYEEKINIDIVKILLAYDANPNIKSDNAVSAMDIIEDHNLIEVKECLVANKGLTKYEKIALLLAGSLALGPIGIAAAYAGHAILNNKGLEGTLKLSDNIARDAVDVAKEVLGKINENESVHYATTKSLEKIASIRSSELGSKIEHETIEMVGNATKKTLEAYSFLKSGLKKFKK